MTLNPTEAEKFVWLGLSDDIQNPQDDFALISNLSFEDFGSRYEAEFDIENTSTSDSKDITVSLIIGGFKRNAKVISLNAGQTKTSKIDFDPPFDIIRGEKEVVVKGGGDSESLIFDFGIPEDPLFKPT